MQLRGWTIIDNRGNQVDVSLTDMQTGMQLANSLFKYDEPALTARFDAAQSATRYDRLRV